jgi:SMODS and SLOG-associating 2TM effector domain 1/Protein of unknown function (DUF4231)
LTESGPSSVLEKAWRRQSVWSQVAGRLKRTVRRTRAILLALTIGSAVLAALAVVVGLDSSGGRALAFAGALTIGLTAVIRPKASPRVIRDWTRARSASEAIKSEAFLYLTRVGPYAAANRDDTLDDTITAFEREVDDLLRHADGLEPTDRPPPGVHDVDSYVSERVTQQIASYYRPQATVQQRRLTRVRWAATALALAGAALAAAAGTWEADSIAVWVPVVTTLTAAVVAHAAAERYEYLWVEYLRTAVELERLRDRRARGREADDEAFIKACEHVISVQNEGWMTKLTGAGDATEA